MGLEGDFQGTDGKKYYDEVERDVANAQYRMSGTGGGSNNGNGNFMATGFLAVIFKILSFIPGIAALIAFWILSLLGGAGKFGRIIMSLIGAYALSMPIIWSFTDFLFPLLHINFSILEFNQSMRGNPLALLVLVAFFTPGFLIFFLGHFFTIKAMIGSDFLLGLLKKCANICVWGSVLLSLFGFSIPRQFSGMKLYIPLAIAIILYFVKTRPYAKLAKEAKKSGENEEPIFDFGDIIDIIGTKVFVVIVLIVVIVVGGLIFVNVKEGIATNDLKSVAVAGAGTTAVVTKNFNSFSFGTAQKGTPVSSKPVLAVYADDANETVPKYNSEIVAMVQKGDVLTITGEPVNAEDSETLKVIPVEYEGKKGYIDARYIRVKK